MGLSKGRLVFDSSDLAVSDQVGANLISGGTVITETSGALDVNIAGSTGLGIQSEDAASSGGELGQLILGYRQDADTSPVTADGDFHGLIFDSVGRLKVAANVDIKSDVADDAADTENPLKMGSRSIDGALSAISASGDKANMISDMYRRVYVNSAPNIAQQVSVFTAGTSALEIAATPLSGRTKIIIQNLGNKNLYIAEDNTVTATGSTGGLQIPPDATFSEPWGEDVDVWGISTAASQDVRVMEVA